MNRLLTMLSLLLCLSMTAQQKISLGKCHEMARENYPLTKKHGLLVQSSRYTLDNITKGYLPKVDVAGQATYQSDVTKVPISMPGVTVPEINNGQYKAYAEINQVLYDGGAIASQKKTAEARSLADLQSLEVELYKIKERVTDLYFGILVFDEQLKQVTLLKADITTGIQTVQAQLDNGTAYRSSADQLTAEYLEAEQQEIAISAYRTAYLQMLGLFINQNLGEETELEIPGDVLAPTSINRPELTLFDLRCASLNADKQTIDSGNKPKFNLFLQGGMGNPGLNMFEKGLDPYYIGGIRMTWSLSGFYTSKKQKQIIDISCAQVEAEKETFLFNTRTSLRQQEAEISKLQKYVETDEKIITLRSNVKKAALAQLENGVISTNDYLKEVNEENRAVQNRIIHKTELLLAKHKHQLLSGN